ncbi:MAG: hypothetical protein ACJ748_00500, partial [Flavisolibacter sp.]
SCGTWIDHWVRHSKQSKPSFCAVVKCWGTDVVGAHVRKTGIDKTVYIAPICHSCNMLSGELLIPDTTILVSATASDKCGKG